MKQLSKSDIIKLNEEIKEQFGLEDFFSKKDRIVFIDFNHKLIVVKDKEIYFYYQESKLIPTLKLLLKNQFLKQVTVDMGAVKHVTAGADVMRPGITEVDPLIQEHDLVLVVDQTHKKPLCVTSALFSGETLSRMEKGKVLKNLHWVGDPVWNYIP